MISTTAAATAAELQKQLLDVEQAITHLKGRQEEGLAITSLDLPKPREYYVINTELKRVACPVCFADVSENALRMHMANSCDGSEVICPAVGCREIMLASELKFHTEHKCTVTKRRRWLAKQAKTRELQKRMEEAKRQEDALLKRKAGAQDIRKVRQHRWPPPDESRPSSGEGGDDDASMAVPVLTKMSEHTEVSVVDTKVLLVHISSYTYHHINFTFFEIMFL